MMSVGMNSYAVWCRRLYEVMLCIVSAFADKEQGKKKNNLTTLSAPTFSNPAPFRSRFSFCFLSVLHRRTPKML